MKRLRFFAILCPLLLYFAWIFFSWTNCSCTVADINRHFLGKGKAIEAGSAIAIFKADQNLPELSMERFEIEEPNHYPFWSPVYFSDLFMLNSAPLTNYYLICGTDTISPGRIRGFSSVPKKIDVYDSLFHFAGSYSPIKIFKENISKKATVSAWKQLHFGPAKPCD